VTIILFVGYMDRLGHDFWGYCFHLEHFAT
jgi:hypothetical protein